MQQEIPDVKNKTVIQYIQEGSSGLGGSDQLAQLVELEESLNQQFEESSDTNAIEALAEQLCQISEEIDQLRLASNSPADVDSVCHSLAVTMVMIHSS
jgi:hypothetical protein